MASDIPVYRPISDGSHINITTKQHLQYVIGQWYCVFYFMTYSKNWQEFLLSQKCRLRMHIILESMPCRRELCRTDPYALDVLSCGAQILNSGSDLFCNILFLLLFPLLYKEAQNYLNNSYLSISLYLWHELKADYLIMAHENTFPSPSLVTILRCERQQTENKKPISCFKDP